MAKIVSFPTLTLHPSTSHQKSLVPSQPFPISSLPISKFRFLLRPSDVAVVPRASSSSAAAAAPSAVVPEDIADVLGDVSIFTAAGAPVKFRDLWDRKEGIAVVALMRHFGCVCCWELAASLKEAKETFDSAGVKLIAVGVGTPQKAQILADGLPFPMDCLYADPERKVYDLLGLYFGLGRTFLNPASLKVFSRGESFKKATENYTIRATPDDISSVLQQGGMFVFKGKQLLYARKDEGTGDHAPLDDIFNVCANFLLHEILLNPFICGSTLYVEDDWVDICGIQSLDIDQLLAVYIIEI